MNDVVAQLEEQNRLVEAHRKEVDNKLTMIHETIERFLISQQTVSARQEESMTGGTERLG